MIFLHGIEGLSSLFSDTRDSLNALRLVRVWLSCTIYAHEELFQVSKAKFCRLLLAIAVVSKKLADRLSLFQLLSFVKNGRHGKSVNFKLLKAAALTRGFCSCAWWLKVDLN